METSWFREPHTPINLPLSSRMRLCVWETKNQLVSKTHFFLHPSNINSNSFSSFFSFSSLVDQLDSVSLSLSRDRLFALFLFFVIIGSQDCKAKTFWTLFAKSPFSSPSAKKKNRDSLKASRFIVLTSFLTSSSVFINTHPVLQANAKAKKVESRKATMSRSTERPFQNLHSDRIRVSDSRDRERLVARGINPDLVYHLDGTLGLLKEEFIENVRKLGFERMMDDFIDQTLRRIDIRPNTKQLNDRYPTYSHKNVLSNSYTLHFNAEKVSFERQTFDAFIFERFTPHPPTFSSGYAFSSPYPSSRPRAYPPAPASSYSPPPPSSESRVDPLLDHLPEPASYSPPHSEPDSTFVCRCCGVSCLIAVFLTALAFFLL